MLNQIDKHLCILEKCKNRTLNIENIFPMTDFRFLRKVTRKNCGHYRTIQIIQYYISK